MLFRKGSSQGGLFGTEIVSIALEATLSCTQHVPKRPFIADLCPWRGGEICRFPATWLLLLLVRSVVVVTVAYAECLVVFYAKISPRAGSVP